MTKADFARFGDPQRFEIALRWVRDTAPRQRRPSDYGWSMGALSITVAGQVLTRNQRGRAVEGCLEWYLAPMLGWLTEHWGSILHEEAFTWPERSAVPAVIAGYIALETFIDQTDPSSREIYRNVQTWYQRHCMRNAAAGGLFPELYIRRFEDDIELSWSASPPFFAPSDFIFLSPAGVARLSVPDVAGPLWEAINWAASNPPSDLDPADRPHWEALARKIDALRQLKPAQLDGWQISKTIHEAVKAALAGIGQSELLEEELASQGPYIATRSPAVAMFGGLSPSLGTEDVTALVGFLARRRNTHESPELADLAKARGLAPLGQYPHKDGYGFAADLLDELVLPGNDMWVDIRAIVERLGICVEEAPLVTDTIRGAAIAGEGFGPAILVNLNSPYNRNEGGKRFSIAHELCHILADRSRARRVTHISGAWATPGIEKRANAFAAYLLMPRSLVLRQLPADSRLSADIVRNMAQSLCVNETALIEHLYNLHFADDLDRERLRAEFRPN